MRVLSRFSVRPLLLPAIVFGIIGYLVIGQLRWIKERHEFVTIEKGTVITRSGQIVPRSMHSNSDVISAVPWSLWLFGEPAYEEVRVHVVSDEGFRLSREYYQNDLDERAENELLSEADRQRIARAKQLFPEAVIVKASFFPSNESDH